MGVPTKIYKNRAHELGFSLIELMIVLVIIGVLVTAGVPTFRRLVQHAKQGEAKTFLGAIYLGESAFFSEYNSYGNNLLAMGVEVNGNGGAVSTAGTTNGTTNTPSTTFVGNLTYCAGFPSSSSLLPAMTDTSGMQIKAVYPGYYGSANGCGTTGSAGSGLAPAAVYCDIGRTSMTPTMLWKTATTSNTTTGIMNCSAVSPCNLTTGGAGSSCGGTYCNGFLASASGVIAPGIDKDKPLSATQVDAWTIDQNNMLVHAQDGTM